MKITVRTNDMSVSVSKSAWQNRKHRPQKTEPQPYLKVIASFAPLTSATLFFFKASAANFASFSMGY